ncbi:MAG: nitrilase-related carbon-nitrogen hydrolase [Pirellulales bacterium]
MATPTTSPDATSPRATVAQASIPDLAPAVAACSPVDRSTVRIALAQIAPRLGDVRHNLGLHLEQISAARSQQADLTVFPELSLTGYFLRDMVPDVALSRDAAAVRELVDAAGDGDVSFGFVEESRQNRFYNAALYAEAGQVRRVHRKVYLPTYGLFDERRYFAPGHRIEAFDTEKFGRVGLLVCEDFWHISAIAIMQAEEVDLLVCIANSPARGVEGPVIGTSETYMRLAQTYAQMLGTAVAFVHRVGFEDGLCFWGGSMIVGPNAEVIAAAPHFDESLLVVEFDRTVLRRQRMITPLARDEQLLITIEELNRIRRRRYDDRFDDAQYDDAKHDD